MTPPRSLVGTIAAAEQFNRFPVRALIFGICIAICALLSFFPERYRAAVTLTPTDPQSLGLSGTLNQLGALNSVFGNQASIEVALRVANSKYVRDIAIRDAQLEKRMGGTSRLELHRWLEDRVTARSLRGGIVLVEVKMRDGLLARDIIAAYARAIQDRLAQISRQQTAYKRDVLTKLVRESSVNLMQAQNAYDTFRLKNRAPNPEFAIVDVSQNILQLEAAIKAKQIALASARQLYSDQNNNIRQIQAEINTLSSQLAEVRRVGPDRDATVGAAVANSSRLFMLQRDLNIQRGLYDSYLRFLQGTAVEDLTSTANVRLLEPPYIDTERQIWWPAAAGGILLLLLWGSIEFYRLRPPIGVRIGDEAHGQG